MSDPTLALQEKLIAVLKTSSHVTALVGQRVFDYLPSEQPTPYITLGQPQVLPDRADCIDGAEVSFPINGWASGPSSVTVKRLSIAILAALDGQEFVISGHRMVLGEVDSINYLDDPDEFTKHVVVTLRVLTEPTD
jgi:hypothetical protein